jgi:hypothetical protein
MPGSTSPIASARPQSTKASTFVEPEKGLDHEVRLIAVADPGASLVHHICRVIHANDDDDETQRERNERGDSICIKQCAD